MRVLARNKIRMRDSTKTTVRTVFMSLHPLEEYILVKIISAFCANFVSKIVQNLAHWVPYCSVVVPIISHDNGA